jgi:hypothetical protein
MSKLLQVLTTFLFLGILFTGNTQGYYPMGSRAQSLGNASNTLEDVWAYHHNPAALTGVKKLAVGISYENRFLLKELQSQGVAVALPLKKGVISFGGQRFGYRNFLSFKTGLGYSLKLSELLSAGVQLNYAGIRLPDAYGSHGTVTAELGLLAKINDKWKLGFSVFNIGRNKLSDYQEDRYTTVMRLGTAYKISSKVLFVAEAEKNVDYPLRGKVGIEYAVVSNFFIRGGFATEPVEVSFGVGYQFKKFFKLDLGSCYHQILGWSPNFSFNYQLK